MKVVSGSISSLGVLLSLSLTMATCTSVLASPFNPMGSLILAPTAVEDKANVQASDIPLEQGPTEGLVRDPTNTLLPAVQNVQAIPDLDAGGNAIRTGGPEMRKAGGELSIGSQSSGAGAGKVQVTPLLGGSAGTLGNVHVAPGATQGFNPQPDPPGDAQGVKLQNLFVFPGAAQGFNPQPDPPGDNNGAPEFRKAGGGKEGGELFNPTQFNSQIKTDTGVGSTTPGLVPGGAHRAIVAPRDAASGLPSGKREVDTVRITPGLLK